MPAVVPAMCPFLPCTARCVWRRPWLLTCARITSVRCATRVRVHSVGMAHSRKAVAAQHSMNTPR